MSRPLLKTTNMQQQIHNGQLVTGLMKALLDGERSLSNIPLLVKRIIKDEMWQEFYVDRTKQTVTHAPSAFVSFVTAQPMEGLGTNIEMLERICAEDKEALSLIYQATQGKHGGDRGNQYTGGKADIISLATNQHGTSRQHALRKLRKSRPDLHAKVLKGKLSPHAAMIEAGFRKKTMTIQSDPVQAAQYLKRRFTKTEFDAFKKELLA
jgi:hypothetical protein